MTRVKDDKQEDGDQGEGEGGGSGSKGLQEQDRKTKTSHPRLYTFKVEGPSDFAAKNKDNDLSHHQINARDSSKDDTTMNRWRKSHADNNVVPLNPAKENGDPTINQTRGTSTLIRFRKLPKELCVKIWKLLTPDARIIELEWDGSVESWVSPHASHNKACVLQSINHESRAVFLQNWLPLVHHMPAATSRLAVFNSKAIVAYYADDTTLAELEEKKLFAYFNPEIDTVYINPLSSFALWNPHHVNKLVSIPNLVNVRRLALAQAAVPSSEAKFQQALELFFTLKRLEHIDMVLDDKMRREPTVLGQRKTGSIELLDLGGGREARLRITFGVVAGFRVMSSLQNRVVKDGHEIWLGVKIMSRGGEAPSRWDYGVWR